MLRSIVFLYHSREDAHRRTRQVGTAFIVQVSTTGAGRRVPFLVAHRQVVAGHRTSVAAAIDHDGACADLCEFEARDWTMHPKGEEVAAVRLDERSLPGDSARWTFSPDDFITPRRIKEWDVGIGDDILIVGRPVNSQSNNIGKPAIRFGSISFMPEESHRGPREGQGERFAVEMCPVSCLPGSPVLVYRTNTTVLDQRYARNFIGLLGINAGYMPGENGGYGCLSGVIPAWRITELLNASMTRLRQSSPADYARPDEHGSAAHPHGFYARNADMERDGILRNMLAMPPLPNRRVKKALSD